MDVVPNRRTILLPSSRSKVALYALTPLDSLTTEISFIINNIVCGVNTHTTKHIYLHNMPTSWSATDITLLSGALIGGLTSIIMVVQRSTCTKIQCGCITCDRVVRSLDELEAARPPDIPLPPELPPIRRSAVESSLSPSSVRDRVQEFERRATR